MRARILKFQYAGDFIKTTYRNFLHKVLFEYKDSTRSRLSSVVYRSIASCCDYLNLSNVARSFVLNSIKTIIAAESKIHGTKDDDVRLHEVSTVDTPADLIGTAVALDDLGLLSQKFYATDVAIGNGCYNFSRIVPIL